MHSFIFELIVCTFAIYGFIEIVKTLYYIGIGTSLKTDGIYLIIAVKNQEKQIEGFLRTVLFRLIYGKEEMIKKIYVADLGSNDETYHIIEQMGRDNENITSMDWCKCKEVIDHIGQVKKTP